MSTFKRILAEKTGRKDYNKKGGQGGTQSTSITPDKRREARANRAQSGGKSKSFVPPNERGISYTTNSPDETVLGGKTLEQADQEITTKQKKRGTQPSSAKTQRELKGFGKDIQTSPDTKSGGKTASPSRPRGATAKPGDLESFMRNQQSRGKPVSDTMQDVAGRKGAGYDFPQNVGTEKPPSRFVKGQRYTILKPGKPAERILGGTGTKTGSLRKGNLKFSGDAKYKRMLRRLTTDVKPLPPGTGVRKPKGVNQAEVSVKQQEFRDKHQRSQTISKKKFASGSSGRVSINKNIQDLIDKIPEKSKTKVTGGTPRVTDLAPTKRPAGTKTFAQFAKSGRTAQQKQATIKALQTPPKPKTTAQPKVKVTAPPKPKAPTKAAVAPKVSKLKIAKGVAGGALSALGAVQSGYEGYSDAKKAGASNTRAWLRGAAKAAGGLIGGTLGGAGGGIVGGIAGYSIGSALADKTFTALAGATKGQKDWMKKANLASQKGTAVNKVKYKKGTQAVIYDPRTKKERIGTFDPTSKTYKAANLATSKAYTTKNPLERLGRQFSRSNEGSGLFGYGIVKGGALADKLKGYYAAQDEKARAKRVSDFKKAASAK